MERNDNGGQALHHSSHGEVVCGGQLDKLVSCEPASPFPQAPDQRARLQTLLAIHAP